MCPFDYSLDVDDQNVQASTEILTMDDDETPKKKHKGKSHSNKYKP